MLDKDEVRDFRRFLNEASDKELARREAAIKLDFESNTRQDESWYDARFLLKLIREEWSVRADLARYRQSRHTQQAAGQ